MAYTKADIIAAAAAASTAAAAAVAAAGKASAATALVVTIVNAVLAAPPPLPPVLPPPPVASPPPPPVAVSSYYTAVRNFYVATAGSDTAGDGSPSKPWATLQGADSSGTLRAGDVVNVSPGIYKITSQTGLAHGGSTNSPIGYVVYRSSTLHGAKLLATATLYNMLVPTGNYMIIDGFEIDGGNAGLTANPVTQGAGIEGDGHHFMALNNHVHHCGGGGIGANYQDWYTFDGNIVHDCAAFNGYQCSGLSIYEPAAVTYTASTADLAAAYHILVLNNVCYANGEWYVPGNHTDGNGIILDDFKLVQGGNARVPKNTVYPFMSLIRGNLCHDNGGRGIHVFSSVGVNVDRNIAFNNVLDTLINGTWRGDLSNALSDNCTWSNNQAMTTSVPGSPWLQYQSAVLDAGGNKNVTWTNNATLDTRTGKRSFVIDDATRNASFAAGNPLGVPLSVPAVS